MAQAKAEGKALFVALCINTRDQREKQSLEAVRLVFQIGDLHALGKLVMELGGDKLPRPRLFGLGAAGD